MRNNVIEKCSSHDSGFWSMVPPFIILLVLSFSRNRNILLPGNHETFLDSWVSELFGCCFSHLAKEIHVGYMESAHEARKKLCLHSCDGNQAKSIWWQDLGTGKLLSLNRQIRPIVEHRGANPWKSLITGGSGEAHNGLHDPGSATNSRWYITTVLLEKESSLGLWSTWLHGNATKLKAVPSHAVVAQEMWSCVGVTQVQTKNNWLRT